MKDHKHTSWEDFSEFAQHLVVALKHCAEVLNPAVSKIAETVREHQPRLEEMLSQAAKVLEQLPEGQRRILEVLAVDGWYPSPEMGLAEISEVIELYGDNDTEQARKLLCQHFLSQTNIFSTNLSNQFPERAEVLNAAINAHLRGEYALSVPVFLAQADGICAQLVGVQLYSKGRDGLPKLAAHQDIKDLAPFLISFLHPVITATPMTASQRERMASSDALNRHAVLHGEVSNYNTQLNSCRALSLLVYAAWIFGELDEFKSSEIEVQARIERLLRHPDAL